MAGDAFSKLKSSLNRSMTAINVNTSASMEKARIKTQIETIEAEAKRMIDAIGEAMYLMYAKGDHDYAKLDQHLEVIHQKKQEIEALKAEYDAVDERKSQILGSNVSEATEIPSAVAMVNQQCPNCGNPVSEGAKFCRKCGTKLQ